MDNICVKCEVEMNEFSISNSRPSYCRACYSEYMRNYLKNPINNKKHRARLKAYRYLQKGVLEPQLCSQCGSKEAEMHHPDYNKPIDVSWMCKKCHEDFHALERRVYAQT